VARGRGCAVHLHLSAVPIEVHHIRPRARGGRDVADNRLALCANGHGDVHYLLDLVERAGGWAAVPWPVRRTYGKLVRRVALQGWLTYRVEFASGRLDGLVAEYSTSGRPHPPDTAGSAG
jgi:hypothetical protein